MTKLAQLYFTDGCHLCENAVSLLHQLSVSYEKIDIINDLQLVTLYGHLIPVIKNEQGQTLNWPFDLQQLQNFIQQENL